MYNASIVGSLPTRAFFNVEENIFVFKTHQTTLRAGIATHDRRIGSSQNPVLKKFELSRVVQLLKHFFTPCANELA
jgi:hypothetical protein